MTVADIERLRGGVDAYMGEADREYYLHFSGQKDALETAAVVERHAGLFTPAALAGVLDALDRAEGDERRRLAALAEAVTAGCVDRSLAPLQDELATAQAHAVVDVDGEEVAYYSAAVRVQNEPDRDRRRRIDAARLQAVRDLDPLRERILARHHGLLQELGLGGYVDAYSRLKGIDLRALGEVMRQFLARTEKLWLEAVTPWFEEVVGVPFAQAERHDAALLFRMREHDGRFAGDAMVPTLRRTLLGLGVALDDQPNVHLDLDDRPAKSPRAFCAPVGVPDEIYLVIRPTGGYQDFRALFHEAGHTEHFAHIDAARPVEERRLGDNSVTEAFAFTMEHLLIDPTWLGDEMRVTGDELASLVRRAHIYYLFMLRRYGGKILYELELHESGHRRPADMRDRYAEHLGNATGFRHDGATYLDDVDPGFYAAQYLRAWMLEAQLRERWRERHGERWWAAGMAGAELRSLWALGQSLPAHELAAELGMAGLDTGAVERRVVAALR